MTEKLKLMKNPTQQEREIGGKKGEFKEKKRQEIRNGKTLTHPGFNSLGWGLVSAKFETLDELERKVDKQKF